MEFDSIIACGDSFTWYHKTAIEKTWPALLGKHYNVPFLNLARGGASNFEIALQPLLQLNLDSYAPQPFLNSYSDMANMAQYKKPLIIFGLTTPYRLPVFEPKGCRIGSISSILPEHLRNVPHSGVDEKIHQHTINTALAKDWFSQMDRLTVEYMYKWQYLIRSSNVLWGTIHFQSSDPTGKTEGGLQEEMNRIKMLHSHVEELHGKSYCFNKIIDWWPLQTALQGPEQHINWNDNSNPESNPIDRHPTNEGIQQYADALIKYIDSI